MHYSLKKPVSLPVNSLSVYILIPRNIIEDSKKFPGEKCYNRYTNVISKKVKEHRSTFPPTKTIVK